MKRIFLFIFILFLVIACTNREVSWQMDEAEAFIDTCPDSTLVILQRMDTTAISTRAQKARYSLLLTMAKDKCYQNISSPEVLTPEAIRYFLRHGTPDEKMKILYYQGSIALQNKDLNAAAIYYTQAEEYAEHVKDLHSLGLLWLSEAAVYGTAHNLKKAKEYTEKGISLYESIEDPMKDAVLGQLALICSQLKEWTRAESLFEQGLAASTSNPHVQSKFLSSYAQMKVLQPEPDPESALAMLDRKLNEFEEPFSLQDAGAYAYALILSGRVEEAERILKQLESIAETNPLKVKSWLSTCTQALGDYQRAYEYLAAAHIAEETEIQRILAESVTESVSEYRNGQAKQRQAQYRLNIASCIIVVLLLFLSLVLMFKRKKRLEAERVRILGICSELEREAATQETRTNDLLHQLDLFRDLVRQERILRFRQAGRLRTSLWRLEHLGLPGWIRNDPSLTAVKKELSYVYDIEDSGEKLVQRLDKELGGVINPLLEELSLRNANDRLFLCCCLLDLPSDVIAARFEITTNNVRVKKHRLREQIARLNNPDINVLFNIGK